jgi:hypothetical protein
MDNILIYSKSLSEHMEHLKLFFRVLREHQLFIRFKKCAFAQSQVEYLGHIITDKGVTTDPTKTVAMLQWPVPSNFTNLRSFLGLTGYYRKFVRRYGILAKPLTTLLQHKQFTWSPEAQQAFYKLKTTMSSTLDLALPNFDLPFVIEIDACDCGVGVVLSQEGHHVGYFSKALSVADQKLSTYEKEFLAVLMAVDKWRSYLVRQPFVIKTDHRSLCHLQDQSMSTEMQIKAMVKFAGLQFTLQYKKGPENKVIDALSMVGHNFLTQSTSVVVPLWIQEVINSYAVDPDAQKLLQELSFVSPNSEGYTLS